jgi:dTDP-L-rhamnose 4-epimerase
MSKLILITGGAGFIGSHLTEELLRAGHRVRVLDALISPVHADGSARPSWLAPEVDFHLGDVLDPRAVDQALEGVDAVFHFAAMVGSGQSMYRISDYTAVNNEGTAVLLEALSRRPVERLVVASSTNIYGEGLYRGPTGPLVPGRPRPLERLRARQWELADADGRPLTPVATPETKQPDLGSVYALSKFGQERLCLVVGQAQGIPCVALRFSNVYGPRQTHSNPHAGALAAFASRLLDGLPPLVFEDGLQRRDFVNVRDAARACLLALESPRAPGRVINIGGGRHTTIKHAAEQLAAILGRPHIGPEITQRHRAGDVRHCFADISLARELLGFSPRVDLDTGLAELAAWMEGRATADRAEVAPAALAEGIVPV